MKQNLTLLFTFVALTMTMGSYATKWRVSNVPGVNANFTTAQAVNDSASVLDGDTVYFEGSGDSYGDLTLSKKLVIIGPGYYLVQNDSTQDNKMAAEINTLVSDPGSDFSVITGMTINAMSPRSNNLVIKRNLIGTLDIGYTISASNLQILQNIVYNIVVHSGSHNLNIQNNLITIGTAWSSSLNMEPNTSATFINNVLHDGVLAYNTEFRNNICTGHPNFGTGGFILYGSSIATNNVFYSSVVSADNGNQINVPMNTVFTYTGSPDGQYKLLAGSPAIGAGYGGVDCGIFGGLQPYVLSGLPTVPAIWQITINGASVEVKAKSH